MDVNGPCTGSAPKLWCSKHVVSCNVVSIFLHKSLESRSMQYSSPCTGNFGFLLSQEFGAGCGVPSAACQECCWEITKLIPEDSWSHSIPKARHGVKSWFVSRPQGIPETFERCHSPSMNQDQLSSKLVWNPVFWIYVLWEPFTYNDGNVYLYIYDIYIYMIYIYIYIYTYIHTSYIWICYLHNWWYNCDIVMGTECEHTRRFNRSVSRE